MFKLKAEQQHILDTYQGGKSAVLATPGSGKTTLISYLVAHLIKHHKVNPGSILVLTFTETAAHEFEHRTISLLDSIRHTPEFSTIHSFCNRMLKKFFPGFSDREVISEEKQFHILESILREYPLPFGSDYAQLFVRYLLPFYRQQFSRFKSLNPSELENKINYRSKHNPLFEHMFEILDDYEEVLSVEHLLDYGMMIQKTYQLFQDFPEVASLLREKYKFVIEDEAQDSNPLQAEVLNRLVGDSGNLLRVGDPNQSIFGFSGADFTTLKTFSQQYKYFPMGESNRSSPQIISLANSIHQRYSSSFPSPVDIYPGSTNPQNGWIWVKDFLDIESETQNILKGILSLLNNDKSVAILCRTNQLCQYISDQCQQAGIPKILHSDRDNDFFNSNIIVLIEKLFKYLMQPNDWHSFRHLLLRLEFTPDIIQTFFDQNRPVSDSLTQFAAGQVYHPKIHYQDYERLLTTCQTLLFLIEHIYYPVSHLLEWITNKLLTPPIFATSHRAKLRLLHHLWLGSGPSRHVESLEQFLKWLQQSSKRKIKQDMISSEEIDNYTCYGTAHILTTHKAKGLEWDGVFMPFFSYGNTFRSSEADIKRILFALQKNTTFQQASQQLIENEVSENIRLAYVGITRAKQYISITWNPERDPTIGLYDTSMSELFKTLRTYYLNHFT